MTQDINFDVIFIVLVGTIIFTLLKYGIESINRHKSQDKIEKNEGKQNDE